MKTYFTKRTISLRKIANSSEAARARQKNDAALLVLGHRSVNSRASWAVGTPSRARPVESPVSMDRPPPKVSKELANAAQDDWMREVQDAAKHRAVRQMEGYDGFKNMVSVAHLRPYHAPNLKDHSGPAPPAFAFTPEGTRAAPAPTPGASSLAPNLSSGPDAPLPPPANSMAFDRAWRRSCKTPERRWEYLVRVMSPESFADVFAVEVTGVHLAEIVAALADGFERAADRAEEDAARVASTLQHLSRAGRFQLARRLVPAKTKKAREGL